MAREGAEDGRGPEEASVHDEDGVGDNCGQGEQLKELLEHVEDGLVARLGGEL